MKPRWSLVFLGLLSALLANSPCRADEPELTLDAVLEKWEKASQECKILDAKLALFQYDYVKFHTLKPKMQYGRFYYESPTISKIEIGKKPIDATNEWIADERTLIWNGSEALRIDPKERTYVKAPIGKIQDVWEQPVDGFLAKITHAFFVAALPPLGRRRFCLCWSMSVLKRFASNTT